MGEVKEQSVSLELPLADGVSFDDPTIKQQVRESIDTYYGKQWRIEHHNDSLRVVRDYTYIDVSEDVHQWANRTYRLLSENGDTLTPLYVAAAYHGMADFSHLGRIVGSKSDQHSTLSTHLKSHFKLLAAELRSIPFRSIRQPSTQEDPDLAYSAERIRQSQEVSEGTPRLRRRIVEHYDSVGYENAALLVPSVKVPEDRIADALDNLPAAETLLHAAVQANELRGDNGFEPLAAWKRESTGWWAMGIGRVMHQLADMLEQEDFTAQAVRS